MHAYHPQLSKYILAIVNHQSNHMSTHPTSRNSFISVYPQTLPTLTTTHSLPNTADQRLAIRLFFLILIPFSKEQQQVYYVLKPINIIIVRTYPVCGTRIFHFGTTFVFGERERERLPACGGSLFASPSPLPPPPPPTPPPSKLISDVQLFTQS